MFVVDIVEMAVQCRFDLRCADLSIGTGQGEDLMAAVLDGARLVDIDVSRRRAEYALMRPQEGAEDRGIGLGPADEEMDLRLRRFTRETDQLRRPLAMRIGAVAGGLLQVGLLQSLQDGGMTAFEVVAFEMDHGRQVRFQIANVRKIRRCFGKKL